VYETLSNFFVKRSYGIYVMNDVRVMINKWTKYFQKG